MALVLADRVQETTTTAGTGPLTLGGAVSGFQSFAVVGNANICYYTVVDGATWEVGVGTYSTTGPTLTRTTVLSNSSGTTSPLTLSSASKPVFLTYPSEKSVNLDASGNVSPLGTVASGAWQGSTVGVAYGGTGVTASSGANSVMLRDSAQNTYVNSVTQALATVTAAAGITTLTVASPHFQILVGTGVQTFKMPDATLLPTGSSWVFDNDSTGNLTITNNAGATIDVVAPGGYTTVFLEADGTVGGTWGRFGMIPAEVNWGTNSLDLGGSTVITNGVWQGTTVASGYGGTGLTTFSAANNALYSTGAATLTAGTLPVLAGGTGATTAAGAQTSLNVPSTTGTGASGTWGINITGSAGSAPGYLPLSGGTLTGPLTVGGSVTIGTGGTYAAGSIYSDASWGMIFRAKQAAPGNAQFRWANSADTELARIDTGGTFINVGAISAPIFYDSNDTSYYLDPNSGASLYADTTSFVINGGSTASAGPVITSSSGGGPKLSLKNTTSGGKDIWWISNGASNSDGVGKLQLWNHTDGYTAATFATTSSMVHMLYGAYTQMAGSSRAPIFYDSDNTAYYLDPASTSVLNTILQAGAYSRTNAGVGYLSGNYNGGGETSSTTGAIYTIGNSYVPSGASFGSMYGIGYCYADGISVGISGATGWGMYVNSNGTNRIWLGADGGTVISAGGHRGTIYYDYNDTTYYVDPASTSNLYDLTIYGASNKYLYINPGNGYEAMVRYNGGSGSGWYVGKRTANVLVTSADFHFYSEAAATTVAGVDTSGNMFASASSRAPIFYDLNDTSYYVDPNSTSRLATVNADVLRSYTNVFIDQQYGSSLIGAYNSTRYQGVYSMGAAYVLPADGTTSGNLYGIAWSYPSAGGAAANLASHGMLMLENGVFKGAWGGGSLRTPADIRAPIFYDFDNTGYYVDPASSSSTALRVLGGALFGPNSSWGAYLAVGTNSNVNTAYASIATSNGNLHMDAAGGYDMYLNYYAGNAVRAYGSFYAAIMYDLNNTGYYVDPSINTRLNGLYVDAVYCYGNVTAYYSSDIKFKENVRTIPNALETVEHIGGKLFDWKDEYIEEHGGEDGYFIQKEDFGVVAQDVLKVFPIAVRTRPDGSLAVDYEKLSALAFAAVAELSTRVKSLEART